MVKTLMNASLVLLLATGAVTAYAQSAGAGEKEVLQALYAIDEADNKRDKAAMERLTADDYIYHSSNGTVQTKAQSIAETMAGGTTWTGRKYDALKVRIYGDVAVVTGTVTLAGKSTTYRVGSRRMTRLFVKRDGRWQDVGGQSTLIPEK
jgi:ketosteroid isomerase-like protein